MAIFDISFLSSSLSRTVQIKALIPAESINEASVNAESKPLKSIYLLHGYSNDCSEWLRESNIHVLAQKHNVAVFFPSGENSFYLDDTARQAFYSKYICEELIGFTRRVFRLSNLREDTSIGGISMGGYGALANGLKRSDVFGNIIALSSALLIDKLQYLSVNMDNPIASPEYYLHTFGNPQAAQGSDIDPKELVKKCISENACPKLYAACGTEDFLIEENRDFHQFCCDAGFEHCYVEEPGDHNWTFWNRHIAKALEWML